LSVDGDVDVNQRKGKVVTIFDVNVKLEYTGAQLQLPSTRRAQGIDLADR
jgi:activator of HSP90 ATPase